MATMFDPASGSNDGVVSRFLYLISLALFFETSMYEMTIVMMVKSFSMVTLGAFDVFSFDGIEFAMLEINRMFATSFYSLWQGSLYQRQYRNFRLSGRYFRN